MPEARRTNAARPKPEHVAAPVEFTWEGATMFGCPLCGTNRQDKQLAQEHIDREHAGGEDG